MTVCVQSASWIALKSCLHMRVSNYWRSRSWLQKISHFTSRSIPVHFSSSVAEAGEQIQIGRASCREREGNGGGGVVDGKKRRAICREEKDRGGTMTSSPLKSK